MAVELGGRAAGATTGGDVSRGVGYDSGCGDGRGSSGIGEM